MIKEKKFLKSLIPVVLLLVLTCIMAVTMVACKEDAKVDSFDISFDANGGNGTMDIVNTESGPELILPANSFERSNYTFLGWSTTIDGAVEFEAGATITPTKNMTLYAVWQRNPFSVVTSASQKGQNQTIKADWSEMSENINKVEIFAYHGQTLVENKTITDSTEIKAGTSDLDVYWGRYNVKIKFYAASDNSMVEYSHSVDVSTDSYNIAYMYATFPVSIFTLQMMDADTTKLDSTEETFVYLSRPRAYDWGKLPANMKPLPVVQPGTVGDVAVLLTKTWIKELYDMNNEAHFTLYFVDIYVHLMCDYFIDNGIPTENWNAIMYSDGGATAGYINKVFGNVENPAAKYAEMATGWNQYVSGEISRDELPHKDAIALCHYTYVANREMSNIKWYTGRLRKGENVFISDATFADTVVNGSKTEGREEFYLNSLLDALTAEEKAAFKALYHIDETVFSPATENGKKIMMILGTTWTNENGNLEDYMRITMEIYGDDYVYFYKGHPGFPTSSYPARQELLDRLVAEGYVLYELDNSVAAEFFLFFINDLEMIGYGSTTFQSGTDANAAGVYAQNLASGYYADFLETYISKITDNAAFNAAHNGITLSADGNYYLAEFKDEMAVTADIAIYDVSTKAITYYKLNAGTYEIVVE